MNAYRSAIQEAMLSGYYVPELESLWFRESNFQIPKFWVFEI